MKMATQQLLTSLPSSRVPCSRRFIIRPSAKAQIQLQFSTYLGGVCEYMQSLHGAMAELFPYSRDTVRGTVLLAMSATHAEKNRMGVREGVMEWDRG